MPAPRLPAVKAKAKGAELKNKARFAGRAQHPSAPLGTPSPWLTDPQRTAWEAFLRELPWLCERDRSLVEIVCMVRARMMSGEDVGVQALNLLRQALGQMGATPADATKVPTGSDDEPERPEDQYFN